MAEQKTTEATALHRLGEYFARSMSTAKPGDIKLALMAVNEQHGIDMAESVLKEIQAQNPRVAELAGEHMLTVRAIAKDREDRLAQAAVGKVAING